MRRPRSAFVGGEQIGTCQPGFVRGFSATEAGNVRLDGFYVDQPRRVTMTLAADV